MLRVFLKKILYYPNADLFSPVGGDLFIYRGRGKIKEIPSVFLWLGDTYKKYAPGVEKILPPLIERGIYADPLW